MPRISNAQAILLITLALTLSGCGSATIAEVEGTVTLDGKPLPNIRVLFQAPNKGGEGVALGAYGLTDESGKFTLKTSDGTAKGAAVGPNVVTLADKLSEDANDSDGGKVVVPKSRIPSKYLRKEFQFEVQPGSKNLADFELTTK